MKHKKLLISIVCIIVLFCWFLCGYMCAKKQVLAHIRTQDYQSDPIRGISFLGISFFKRYRGACESWQTLHFVVYEFKVKVYWRQKKYAWTIHKRGTSVREIY
ncbi:hypothetical protein [Candidatus Uabimicrobium sp. HlEnr_7]|uniref:hypothetical protein n=1 Tax=Candidatus Uabimicrobium helgolandensis TaxID=3095367 RepID=UPI0035567C2F